MAPAKAELRPSPCLYAEPRIVVNHAAHHGGNLGGLGIIFDVECRPAHIVGWPGWPECGGSKLRARSSDDIERQRYPFFCRMAPSSSCRALVWSSAAAASSDRPASRAPSGARVTMMAEIVIFGPSSHPRVTIADASHAVAQGRQAIESGYPGLAAQWFDRALRLAPANAPVTLLLASSLSGRDDIRAERLLRNLIADRPSFREGSIALAAARLRAGDAAEAASLLDLALSRAAPAPDPAFAQFALATAHSIGRAGWAGLGARGAPVDRFGSPILCRTS